MYQNNPKYKTFRSPEITTKQNVQKSRYVVYKYRLIKISNKLILTSAMGAKNSKSGVK